MNAPGSTSSELFTAVVNKEEQYSIWPLGRPLPLGWTVIGQPGPAADCLAYVTQVWTDLRPLSLRLLMARSSQTDESEEP